MAGARFLAPSKLGEAVYQAQRRARFPRVNGIPDLRATFAPGGADRDDLSRYARFAFDAYLDEQAPPAWRAQVTTMLLADLDHRCPPDDMVVLARYGLTDRRTLLIVEVDGAAPQRFPLLEQWRDIPRGSAANQFSANPAWVTERVSPAPAETMPLFDAIAAAHARKGPDFDDVKAWPSRFLREQKRQPTWGEIEAAFPRIGAWLAARRASA